MQRIKELFLLLLACGVLSFLLHWHLVSRPAYISGTVVNWMTGQPVSGVEIRYLRLIGSGGSTAIAWTDTQGHFTALVPDNRLYWLYAGGPRFGPILGFTFGRTVAVYTPGEQHLGVVVPAIPGTELSGYVYDEGVTPLQGCEVFALTDSGEPAHQLVEVSSKITDGTGAFTFNELGADRYFVLVRCHRYLPGEHPRYSGFVESPWKVRNSWQPTLFPQAVSLDEAKAIVLFPGDRRRDIDFHLRSVPQYSIHGTLVLSRSLPPGSWPNMISRDLKAVPLNPAVAVTAPEGEACDLDVFTQNFHCDFLPSGTYHLSFEFNGNQKAEVNVEVKNGNQIGPEITVQLQEQARHEDDPSPLPAKDSLLRLQRICPEDLKTHWVRVLAWGPTSPSLQTPFLTSCAEDKIWPIAAGDYTITAFQGGFFESLSRYEDKITPLLQQHGRHVSVQKGKMSFLSVPVWSTDDIIRWALASLQQNHEDPK